MYVYIQHVLNNIENTLYVISIVIIIKIII